jgi:iron complex outermembrane receptor protein
VVTTGVETDIQLIQNLERNRQLLLNAGVVFLNSETGNTAPSLYIASHANLLTNFNISYTTPSWSLGLAGLYKDRKKQVAPAIKADVSKDYFVLHARAEAFVIKRKLSLLLQVDNLLDRTYSDLLGAQMPQRWLMGGARLAL